MYNLERANTCQDLPDLTIKFPSDGHSYFSYKRHIDELHEETVAEYLTDLKQKRGSRVETTDTSQIQGRSMATDKENTTIRSG